MNGGGRNLGRELGLWIFSAAVVVVAHGGIAAALAVWSVNADPGGAPAAVMIEMAPLATESASEHANLPVAPPQPEQTEPAPTPEPEHEPQKESDPEPEQKVAEVTPLPEPPPPLPPTPPVKAEITLPPEEPQKEKKPQPKKKIAVATAPERAERVSERQKAQAGSGRPSANIMQSYAANVIRPHLLRHISSGGLKDGGVVVVTFSITRQGRLTSKNVSRSSGHREIDGEALSTLQRAQPYPPPPPELTQQSFVFTLPMRYNIR